MAKIVQSLSDYRAVSFAFAFSSFDYVRLSSPTFFVTASPFGLPPPP